MRLQATIIHTLTGGLLFSVIIWPIVCLWYPQGLLVNLGAINILLLIIGVDLTLGPLLTACVFSPKKTARHRWIDESIVLLLQITGLCIGMYTLYHARPVYIVWHSQQFYVVQAKNIQPEDWVLAPENLKPSLSGPRWVYAEWPSDIKKREEGSLFSLTAEGMRHYFPQYFLPLTVATAEIKTAIAKTQGDDLHLATATLPASVDETALKVIVDSEVLKPLRITK